MEESIEETTVIVLPNGKTFPRKVYSAYTAEELKEVIGCCYSIKHIIETLRINRFYHRYIKEFIKEHNISTVHFKPIKREPVEKSLVKGTIAVCSKNIKKYLTEKKLVNNECAVCKIPPVWNNSPLTLQLDHINGNHYDNRVENLRLICPNCHSQTDTYTGKNVAKYEKKKCSVCNEKELKNNNISGKCAKCINKEMIEGICSECNTNERFGDYLKCKECLDKSPPPKLCKKCEKPIKRSYNNGDYHMRCHKGIEKEKKEEL